VIPTAHAAAAARLHRSLLSFGLDADAVFERVGLGPVHARGEARAPREALLAAKAEAARALDDPWLGFRLGALATVDTFDVYGAALAHASTLQEAIRWGVRYGPVWEQGARLTLEHGDGRVWIVYGNPLIGDPLANIIDSQESVVFVARAIISMCPSLSSVVAVDCSSPRPRHAHCMEGLRTPKLRASFDQPRWAVGVSKADLNAPMPTRHPAVAPLLQARLEDELEQLEPSLDLRARLAVQLRQGLRLGWSQSDVGDALGLSPRKLQLELQGLGSSYSHELARVREQVAKELLARDELPLKQIAERLGFASLASFSRFFHQQTGQRPSEYRARSGG
jgi:AraC-like DNA-binding protein